MLGRVVFWYRFHQKTRPWDHVSAIPASGHVLFKIYGQKCQRCSSDVKNNPPTILDAFQIFILVTDTDIVQEFETALWYPEEISNAVWHLYADVAEKYYGRSVSGVVERIRQGKPVRPHKPQLCQACADGICKIKKKNR